MLTKLATARKRTSLDIVSLCRVAIIAIFIAGCGGVCGAATRAAVQAVVPVGATKLDDCANACYLAYNACIANGGTRGQCAAQESVCLADCP